MCAHVSYASATVGELCVCVCVSTWCVPMCTPAREVCVRMTMRPCVGSGALVHVWVPLVTGRPGV